MSSLWLSSFTVVLDYFFLLCPRVCMALFKSRLSKININLADFVNCSLDTAQFQIRNRFYLLTVTVPSQSRLATSLTSPCKWVLVFRITCKLKTVYTLWFSKYIKESAFQNAALALLNTGFTAKKYKCSSNI